MHWPLIECNNNLDTLCYIFSVFLFWPIASEPPLQPPRVPVRRLGRGHPRVGRQEAAQRPQVPRPLHRRRGRRHRQEGQRDRRGLLAGAAPAPGMDLYNLDINFESILFTCVSTSAVKRSIGSTTGCTITEKALVGAFSVIVQLHRLIDLRH